MQLWVSHNDPGLFFTCLVLESRPVRMGRHGKACPSKPDP